MELNLTPCEESWCDGVLSPSDAGNGFFLVNAVCVADKSHFWEGRVGLLSRDSAQQTYVVACVIDRAQD